MQLRRAKFDSNAYTIAEGKVQQGSIGLTVTLISFPSSAK